MKDEMKSLRLQMVITPSQVAEIDAWRKVQADLPSRSEAIRRLVELALKGERFLLDLRAMLLQLAADADHDPKIDDHISELDAILGEREQ